MPTAPTDEQRAEKSREIERQACRVMIDNLKNVPALDGVPALASKRVQVLGRAKAWPVVFRRAPQMDTELLDPYFLSLSNALHDPRRVFGTLKILRKLARNRRKQVRHLLLPEGYFFASDPRVARWLVQRFDLTRLFSEPVIWLLRGSNVYRLVRTKHGYKFADEPRRGQRAHLLLFDRVTTRRADLFPTLHTDFVPAARRLGFDRLEVVRKTPLGFAARLRYGSDSSWTQAVFTSVHGEARLACEVVTEAQRRSVRAFRRDAHLRNRLMSRLRSAIRAHQHDRLPFDEPKEEVGQQDGSLRPQWEWSYLHDMTSYRFNDVSYSVFDLAGHPHPPEVCIDFILDVYERASGTWYQDRGRPRERVTGGVDFRVFDMPNRRSVKAVVTYFREHPGTFHVWDLDEQERIRFRDRVAFIGFVASKADQFREGNVVLIHGPRGGEAHYHSFIVVLSDPLTGFPLWLADNSGHPRVRAWERVMGNAPLRSIKHVLTPDNAWLRTWVTKGSPTLARVETNR